MKVTLSVDVAIGDEASVGGGAASTDARLAPANVRNGACTDQGTDDAA